jgi:hypothetical protein
METCNDEDHSARTESLVDVEDGDEILVGITEVPLVEFGIDKFEVWATTIRE